ncbi:hypothetical protein PHMEG_00030088 [Phytophthora megakarya]|uniref:Reverse transcriptase domain-containing protein n=1 Tax=Phytophthora megakarya TaxID=4795 RepID=A0A225V2N9_9STRA|nr:hypothetical protein PHMEG_00030088 [Phytophthora megakarya]
MTDSKVYTPTRVHQGCSDTAIHFQRTMESCFKELLYKHLLVWVDDLLLDARCMDEYLEKREHLFRLMNESRACTRKRKVDPERIKSLREIPYPTTATGLQQFLCTANWLRENIVGSAEAIKPLQEGLDDALGNKRSRSFHRSPDGDMVLVTDASDKGWSIVVTQVEKWDSSKDVGGQSHSLLTCLSGTFNCAKVN